jgi:HK97 family phage prohead protease
MVEKNALINDMDTEQTQFIEVSGYASRMLMDNKYVIDADNENINTFGFDLKRLKNGILPLLYQHDQSKAIGKVTEATYDKEGLLIKAIIYKYKDDSLTNYCYQAIKSGVLSSFSVGILVKDFEVINQDNEDYLQLSQSEVIEVSVISVPSNPEALFRVTNLKSVDGLEKTVTLLSKSALKAENTDACDGFECAMKQKAIKEDLEVEKEITLETKNTEEAKETVVGVTDAAYEKLDEILNQEDETSAPEQDTERAEGATVTSPESNDSQDTDKSNDKPSEEPKVDLEQTPEEKLHNSLTNIGDLDISKLSDDEMEKVYEALAPLIEQIEARVVAQVAEAYVEGMTITPQ